MIDGVIHLSTTGGFTWLQEGVQLNKDLGGTGISGSVSETMRLGLRFMPKHSVSSGASAKVICRMRRPSPSRQYDTHVSSTGLTLFGNITASPADATLATPRCVRFAITRQRAALLHSPAYSGQVPVRIANSRSRHMSMNTAAGRFKFVRYCFLRPTGASRLEEQSRETGGEGAAAPSSST